MDLEGNHEIIASESGSGLDVVVRRMRQGDGGESIVSFCSETNSGSLRKMFSNFIFKAKKYSLQ